MRVHHLDCISMCPPLGGFFDGRTPWTSPARLTCHCLLVETSRSLVLVDTGFGMQDVANPSRLSAFFRLAMRPPLSRQNTARGQIEALGYKAEDVGHIVLTHLDFDHAGGIDDFPRAQVHLLADEYEAARAQRTWLDRRRFRPQQWSGPVQWRLHDPNVQGAKWFGFSCARDIDGLEDDILLVPLVGHTLGHAGVAIRTPDRWLLHAGDAYFHADEMNSGAYACPPGLRLYQAFMEKNREARWSNQRRLRALKKAHGGEVELFCAHDAAEFEACRQRASASSWPQRRVAGL